MPKAYLFVSMGVAVVAIVSFVRDEPGLGLLLLFISAVLWAGSGSK